MKLSVHQNEGGLWLEGGTESWSFPLPRGVTATVDGDTAKLESLQPIFLADPGVADSHRPSTADSLLAIAVRRVKDRTVLFYRWPTHELQLATSARPVHRHARKAGWVLPAMVELTISAHRVSPGSLVTSSLTITTNQPLDRLAARAQTLVGCGQNILSRSHLPTRRV